MFALLRNLLRLRKALTSDDAPRQLAWAFALGMMLGLLPKGNLLFVAVSTCVFACRVNLSVVVIATLLFSCLGGLIDPIAHPVGLALLTWDVLVPTWERLHGWPFVPWTAFNNTVVMGNLVLGTALFYPTYRATLLLIERFRPPATTGDPTADHSEERVPHPVAA